MPIKYLDIPNDLKYVLNKNDIYIGDIVLYITGKCNLRCKHCYIGNNLLEENIFYSKESIIETLNNFLPLDRLTIIGGEPFLHPNIEYILKKISTMNIKEKRVSTNLTYLPLDFINKFPKNIRYSISLDSHIDFLHNKLRGDNTFDKTLNNIKILIDNGFDLEINHTITNQNISQIDSFISFLKKINIKRLNLHLVSIMGNAIKNASILYVSPTQWRNLLLHLENKKINNGDLLIRYEQAYATKKEYDKLIKEGIYKHHSKSSFYSKYKRIVIYPDQKCYMSSEAFSTNSYIAKFDKNKTFINYHSDNEIFLSEKDTFNISNIRPIRRGDKNYPIALSVSYRNFIVV